MGKGDKRRPRLVSREVYELRWDLAHGEITPAEYEREIKKCLKEKK